MKTRHLKIVLLLILVLALATACGGKSKPGEESDVGLEADGAKDPV